MVTFRNATGYNIDSIDSIDNLVKVDDEHYIFEIEKNVGWNETKIEKVYYSNSYLNKSLSYSDKKAYCFVVADNDVHYISKPEDLLNMSDGYYYECTKVINLNGYEWLDKGNLFGVFNGKGFSIQNMSVVGSFKNQSINIGLFNQACGVIEDVTISNGLFIVELVSDDNKCHTIPM